MKGWNYNTLEYQESRATLVTLSLSWCLIIINPSIQFFCFDLFIFSISQKVLKVFIFSPSIRCYLSSSHEAILWIIEAAYWKVSFRPHTFVSSIIFSLVSSYCCFCFHLFFVLNASYSAGINVCDLWI